MPRTDTVTIPKDQWTQLTNSDATAVTFQAKRGTIHLVAMVGAVAPTTFDDALLYQPNQGEVAIPMASLAPGTAGANRLYAYPWGNDADIYVSHA